MTTKGRMPSKTTTWITPRKYIDALGPFDLDPCAAPTMPWRTAAVMYNEESDGLNRKWEGFVWCNPPYGTGNIEPWLTQMALHRNGIGLYPSNTETKWFQEMMRNAYAIYFLNRRIKFCDEDGVQQAGNPVGSVFACYGWKAVERVDEAHWCGAFGGMLVVLR